MFEICESTKYKNTGQLKVREEQVCGQIREYSLEEIAQCNPPEGFKEYCKMEYWETPYSDLFLSRRKHPKYHGKIYNSSDYTPILIQKEEQITAAVRSNEIEFFWKGAFLNKKTKGVRFIQGFKLKDSTTPEEFKGKNPKDRKLYYSESDQHLLILNCPMLASKAFWIELIIKANELLDN